MLNRRVAAAIICFVLLDDDEVKTRGETRSWIKRRKQRGAFSNIVHELGKEDTATFKEMLRMDCEWHLFLHKKVIMEFPQSKLMKGWHSLRFLTTGETFKSLRFQFWISRSAISYIVIPVCEALTNHLGNLYLKNTISEWRMDVRSS